MEGKLPEIYWYVFWIGVVIVSFRMAYLGGKGGHERAMKALDILKMYAERGSEPPQSVMDQLGRQVLEAGKPESPKRDGRSALIQSFVGFLFMACFCSGIFQWFNGGDGPKWIPIAAQAGMAFFGFGAFGFAVLALLTREK